jgi:hypothetical protein
MCFSNGRAAPPPKTGCFSFGRPATPVDARQDEESPCGVQRRTSVCTNIDNRIMSERHGSRRNMRKSVERISYRYFSFHTPMLTRTCAISWKAPRRPAAAGDNFVVACLRPCDWHDLPFGRLLATPKDGKAITTWPNIDSAFLDVVTSIKSALKEVRFYAGL